MQKRWFDRRSGQLMAKIKVQAQHLQPGDIVGSGESVSRIIINSTKWPSSKVYVELLDDAGLRSVLWGKYTMINVEREEKVDGVS